MRITPPCGAIKNHRAVGAGRAPPAVFVAMAILRVIWFARKIPACTQKPVVLHQILPCFCQKQGRRCMTGRFRQNVENP